MLKRTVKIVLGVALIILGAAGIFLPVVPGLLLMFIGFAFLVDKDPKLLFMDIVAKAKQRYKKVSSSKE